MITPNTWAAVPGSRHVQLYAVLRKPSITCSSTFILQTPRLAIVLDPGADEAQVEHVGTVITSLFDHGALPLYLFLTHSHVDHLLVMPALMGPPFQGRLFCHPVTAEALAKQDGGITQADMIDITVPRMKAQARFFDPPEALPLDLIRDLAPRLITGTGREKDPPVIFSLQISDEDAMEVLLTPGHSPDSVCYRVGSFMFTGDLHLATSPGLAGLKGWNNDDLVRSIGWVLEKCRTEHISCIVPGHGPPIEIDKAERILSQVQREAIALSDLKVLNRQRAEYLSDYAIVLLEEAGSLFSIIAARLLKVSYYLELLEEQETAGRILDAIDSDAIEKIVDEFYYFMREMETARGVPVIAKAVQFSKKVRQVFSPANLQRLVEKTLLRRIDNLLTDFVNAAYGITFSKQEIPFDMHTLIEETLSLLRESPHESESIFGALDDEREFMNELAGRIAHEPLFSSIRFEFRPEHRSAAVIGNRDLLQDALHALLEQYALSGAKTVVLETGPDGDAMILRVSCKGEQEVLDLRASKLQYLSISMIVAGGRFFIDGEAADSRYCFSFPLAR